MTFLSHLTLHTTLALLLGLSVLAVIVSIGAGASLMHGRMINDRIDKVQPGGIFPDGQLRTLQRRLKEWRREQAHKIVFGPEAAGEMPAQVSPIT